MRIAFKGLALAASLALAGLMPAAAQAPAKQEAPAAAAAAPAANAAAPAATAAKPTSPELAMDGAPAMTVKPMLGQPTDGLMTIQPQVTEVGRRAHGFHDHILLPLITAISLFVLALLIWVVIRYRRAANPVPSKTSHNTAIEIAWTLIPVLILVAVAVPSIGLLNAQYKPAPANAVTLKAIGNQWYWSYQYPDNGGLEITANMLKEKDQVAPGERYRTDADGPRLLAVDNRIVLPVGVPIRLITTANDVIHSWAIPAFWIKLDAVPGRLNETSFTIEKPGLYFGQCSELCGARHGFMPIAVEAVPPAEFAAWVKAKGGTMPGEAKPAAAAPAAAAAAPAANAAAPTNTAEAAPANASAGAAATGR
ncbi:MAG: cytochrome c oxidase subunit II [Sphingomonadales bacterium]|nr:cytochrome c oxidase subunit II [Sphingomonadales bacterium]